MKQIIGFILVINTSSVLAVDWNCRNHDMEISCRSEKCEVADSFTPMDVSFTDKGKISVCAYTGCWEGVGKVFSNKNHMIISAHDLKFSTSSSDAMKSDILIALDTKDNISVIKTYGYAMPMTCKKILKK